MLTKVHSRVKQSENKMRGLMSTFKQ